MSAMKVDWEKYMTPNLLARRVGWVIEIGGRPVGTVVLVVTEAINIDVFNPTRAATQQIWDENRVRNFRLTKCGSSWC